MLFLWEAWQKETRPAPPVRPPQPNPPRGRTKRLCLGKSLLRRSKMRAFPLPGTLPGQAGRLLESGGKIVVKTDLLTAEIDTAGGDLRRLELLDHPTRETRVSHLRYWRASTTTFMWPVGDDRRRPSHSQDALHSRTGHAYAGAGAG